MMRVFLGILLAIVVALAGAFFYFSEPDISRKVLEAQYATPPSAFIVLPDGARAHYRDRGPKDAPALLLLHGSNASLFTWEPWSKSLSDHFRVVSVDLPGHGLTGAVPNGDYSQKGMATFVHEFADAIGLQQFALAGNSMGGGVAARFAEMYPERVSRLILVDAGGMPIGPGDRIPLGFKLARMSFMKPILLHVTPRALFAEGLNDAIVHKAIITDAMVDQYWRFARMEGTREATADRFQTNEDYGYVKAHIDEIKAPTLILWGAEDHLIPVAAAYAFHRAIPGSKVIVYPATGHIPMEEVAQESSADVRNFLSATGH